MLVMLASIHDPHAMTALEHWRGAGHGDAQILTCHNVAQPGWRVDGSGELRLVLDDSSIPAGEITGVLTRLPRVVPDELPFVDDKDREYAAAEIQAFLVAFLHRLECPVVNTPTPGCLSGLAWSDARWVRFAASLNLPVRPIVHRAYAGGTLSDKQVEPALVSIHVVGDKSLTVGEDQPESLHKAARELAHASGSELLRVSFVEGSDGEFVHADSWIDMSDSSIANLVAERLLP